MIIYSLIIRHDLRTKYVYTVCWFYSFLISRPHFFVTVLEIIIYSLLLASSKA